MSSEAGASEVAVAAAEVPPFRYTAALADQIELAWQDRWEREGTFNVPNPIGPLSQGFDAVADRHHLFVMDMFPYPVGGGPARRTSARVHRYRRLRQIPAHARRKRTAHDGFRCLRTAGRAIRGADRAASGGHDVLPNRRVQTAAAADGSGPRSASGLRDHRQGLLPLDPMDLPPDFQQLLRPRGRACSSDYAAGRRAHVGYAGAGGRYQPVRRQPGGSCRMSNAAR